MAVDPHEEEPTQEITADKYKLWQAFREAIKNAEAEELRLRKEIEAEMGTALAATVNGVKVLTRRPTARYASRDLIKAYPELTEHYMVTSVGTELDMAAFSAHHKEIADKYRVYEFREVKQ